MPLSERTRSYRWRTPRDPRKFPEIVKTSTAANTANTFRTFPETLKTISTAANTVNTFRTTKDQNAGRKTNISPDCKSREITGPPQRWNLLIGCRVSNADTAMISAAKPKQYWKCPSSNSMDSPFFINYQKNTNINVMSERSPFFKQLLTNCKTDNFTDKEMQPWDKERSLPRAYQANK